MYSGRRINLFRNRVGPSVSLMDTLLETITQIHRNHHKTLQFHLRNNDQNKLYYLSPDTIHNIREYMKYKLMSFHIHSPFSINLASNKPSTVNTSIQTLNKILNSIAPYNATCVVHCGSIGNSDESIRNLNRTDPTSWLLLENSAGAGTQLGSTIEDIKYFFSKITRSKTALCIDIQHAFAAGVTQWDSYEESQRILYEYSQIAPIKLIHLNDSKVSFGSRVDSHQIIGQGQIWSEHKSAEGLLGILDWCAYHDIDIVEETSDSSASISYLRYIKDSYI